jgi:tetratricopeptide (TPR) repeat protein
MKYIFLVLILALQSYAQNIILGDSLVEIGKYNEAINSYKLASENSRNYKIAKVFEAKGNKNEALKYYQNYLKNDSTSILINFDYGLLLINVSKYAEAQTIFDKLVKSQNKNPIFLYYLGLANEKQNEHSIAFKNYKLASEIDSTYHKSNYKLAYLYSQIKQEKEAIKICNRFIKQNADDIDMLKLRAQLFYVLNDYSKAISDYESLLKLNQDDDFIFKDIAKAYFKLNQFKKAIEIYNYLIELNPEDSNYYYERALCFGNLSEYKNAQIDLDKTIELKQVTFESEYFYKAYFYQKNVQLNYALKFYNKAFKENKENEEAYYQICVLTDYKEVKKKNVLPVYERFLTQFPNANSSKSEYVKKRISQIKQELHMQ